MEQDIFLLTLISYAQHYGKCLTCNNFPLIKTENKFKNPSPQLQYCSRVTEDCIITPAIVSSFLKFFNGASVYQKIKLEKLESPAQKNLFSLTNFPCPYRLPANCHVHRNNRSYIIYSPAYTENFHFLYVGCHCDNFRKRVTGSNLLITLSR